MISAMLKWFDPPLIVITPPTPKQKSNPADDFLRGWTAKKVDRIREEVKKTGWNKL